MYGSGRGAEGIYGTFCFEKLVWGHANGCWIPVVKGLDRLSYTCYAQTPVLHSS